MNEKIKEVFYKPINNDDLFWLIKPKASIKNFIEKFEYKSSIEEQISIVNQLIKILSYKKSTINICIINRYNESKIQNESNLIIDEKSSKALPIYQNENKVDFADWLIRQYFLYKSEKSTKGILNLLLIILNIIGVQKKNFNFIYQKISEYFFYSPKKYFYDDAKINIGIDINNLSRFLNLLLLMYGYNNKVNKPYNFYYFGNDSYLKIEPVLRQPNNNINLKGGVSIFTCFNCLLNPKTFLQNYSIICSIQFNNGIFFYMLVDREMNLIMSINNDNLMMNKNIDTLNTMNNSHDIKNKILLTKIENNKWYNIVVSLKMKKNKKIIIHTAINSNNYDCIEIDNSNSLETIENIFLYKDFMGYTTSFLLYNTYIDIKDNSFFNNFQYGLYKISHISKYINRQLYSCDLQNLIILIIPSEIKSNNIHNFANFMNLDLSDDLSLFNNNIKIKITMNFKKCKSDEILYFSGVNINSRLDKRILLLGGINNLLPLFEILLLINKKIFDTKNFIYLNIFQRCLICLLKIIEVIISLNKKNKIKKIINKKFINILSLFLEKITFSNEIEMTVFNDKLIAILKNIGDLLLDSNFIKKQKLCNEYFNRILLNKNIIKKLNISQQIKINDYIYKCILNNNTLFIDYKNLIFLMKYFNKIYSKSYCCKEHYLFIKEITNSESKLNFNRMLTNLLDINSKLLSQIIKNDSDAYIDLLNLLIGKTSPCFVELILKNVFYQNLKNNNEDINHTKKILITLLKNNILYILLYLLSIYIYPNIVKEIIELYSIISYLSNLYSIELNNFFKNSKILNYIGNSIYPIFAKIKGDFVININKNTNFKVNHFFSTNVMPYIEYNSDELDYSFSNIKRSKSCERLQINNSKPDDDSRKSLKVNKPSEKFERKKILSRTIKFHKSNSLKFDSSNNKNLNINYNKMNNFQFSRKFNKTNTIKETNPINFQQNKSLKHQKTIDKPNNMIFLLTKLENDRKFIYKRIILDSLLNWITINRYKYVFEIIIKFITNIEFEYIHFDKFVDSFNQILIESNKQNTSLNDLIDLRTFRWFFDMTFQFYLLNNKFNNFSSIPYELDKKDLINNIVINSRKIINNIFLYNINNNELEYIIENINYAIDFNKKFKNKYKNESINDLNNALNIFYRNFLSDILNICQKHFFPNNKNNYDSYFNLSDEEEKILIFVVNICYEFIFFNNIENNYIEINNFLKSKSSHIFNNILLSDIHIISNFENIDKDKNFNSSDNGEEEEDIFSIKKYFGDFSVFEKLISILRPLISLNTFGNFEDDKYLIENILNNKRANTHLGILKLLCFDNINISNSINLISLIYIISNSFIFYINLSKNKKELKLILDNYKSFIIFLILSSSNLLINEEDAENTEIINNINKKVIIAINYYIHYIFDKYKANSEFINNYLIEIFKLMIRIMNNIYIQIRNKKKNIIFSIISSEKKSNKVFRCSIHEIFLSEVMIKIFTREYISSLIKNKFKDFKNTQYFIELCGNIFKDFNLRYELKNIFNIECIIKKYLDKEDDNDNDNDNNKENQINTTDFSKDKYGYEIIKEKIIEKIKTLVRLLTDNSNNYYEKMFLKSLKYKNEYKKVKKALFGYNGFWNYKSLDNITINGEGLKYKLINHYSSVLFRNILLPIFDLNSYMSQYQFINKIIFFKPNKNMNINNNIIYLRKNITNLNYKKIFVNINKESEQNHNRSDSDSQFCLSEEIGNISFPDLIQYINRLENEFDIIKYSKKSIIINNSYSCCYVKPETHIKGYLFLSEKKIKFIMDIYNNEEIADNDQFDKERGCCYGCLIKNKNLNKFISFKIKYSSIKYIFLRKYYYKNSSIEIFTSKNKSYYINIHNPKLRQYILDIILIHISHKKEIKIKENKLIGYDFSNYSQLENIFDYYTNSNWLDDIVKKWVNWKITSFDLLIYINTLSNRSFNDLTQYPVFPWILTEYNDFACPIEKNEKENKNENSINDSELNEKENNINQYDENINSIMDNTTIKPSSESSTKYIQYSKKKNEIKELIGNYMIKYIRDFSIPMGMMNLSEEGEKRKKKYLEKYNSKMIKFKDNPEMENENYIYNTHYSNPKYIAGYLARIFPYINILKNYNCNEEILISVEKTFINASSKKGDLKELCPEFFYLPEMFININYLDLKTGNDNEIEFINKNPLVNSYTKEKDIFHPSLNDSLKERRLNRKKNIINNNMKYKNSLLININFANNNYNYDNNDVLMPKWAENNPYNFVTKMKYFLESDRVGNKINYWIDLIFGYKQKGNNSKISNNIFPPWTYETFDIRKIKNDNKSKKNKSFYYKLVDQGQTPHQLLNNPFPQRKPKPEKDFSFSLMNNYLKYNSFKNKKRNNLPSKIKVIKIKFIDNENIICVFNSYLYTQFNILKYALIIDIKIDYFYRYYLTKEIICKYNYLLMTDFEIVNLNQPIIIYSKGRFIAQGGFYNGLILISEIDLEANDKAKYTFSSIINNIEIFNEVDNSPIVSLVINEKEDVIFSGTYMGSIIIYDIDWKIKSIFNDHQHLPITSINFNDYLNIWGSACIDGYIKLYTYPTNKPILSKKVEQSSVYADFLNIISSPLPSFVIYCRKNLTFYSYSLLGKLIHKDKEDYINIKSPVVFKDIYGNDKLLYGDDMGCLNIRLLPSLDILTPFEINESSINIVDMNRNSKYCVGWSDDEEEIYIAFDPNDID